MMTSPSSVFAIDFSPSLSALVSLGLGRRRRRRAAAKFVALPLARFSLLLTLICLLARLLPVACKLKNVQNVLPTRDFLLAISSRECCAIAQTQLNSIENCEIAQRLTWRSSLLSATSCLCCCCCCCCCTLQRACRRRRSCRRSELVASTNRARLASLESFLRSSLLKLHKTQCVCRLVWTQTC